MTLERKLLDILVCPITKQSVRILDEDRLSQLNQLIEKGEIQSVGGQELDTALTEALITENGSTVYPVENQIPIMLEDRGIACHQIEGW